MDKAAFETGIRLRYAAMRDLPGDAGTFAVLHIGAEQTGIAVGHQGQGAGPQATLALAIGSHRTAREHFKHSPPSPLELEYAIVTVEDEVTRTRQLIPDGTSLYTSDALVREIAVLSGVGESAQMRLSLEAMERTFDRLTSVALGTPAAHHGLPSSNTFAAALLILREFMHHLQFSSITVVESRL
jgi:hypothetical protein